MDPKNFPPHIKALEQHFLEMFGTPILTPKQAAIVLGSTVGNLAVYRCHRQGPPYEKHGRSVRYNLYALLERKIQNEVVPA